MCPGSCFEINCRLCGIVDSVVGASERGPYKSGFYWNRSCGNQLFTASEGHVVRPALTAISLLERREALIYAVLVFGRSCLSVLDLAIIFLMGVLISLGMGESPSESVAANEFPGVAWFFTQGLPMVSLLTATLLIIKSFFATLVSYRLFRFLARVEARLASKILHQAFAPDFLNFKQQSRGDILWASNTSIQQGISMVLIAFSAIVGEGILVLVILLSLVWVSPGTAALIVAYFGVASLLLFFPVAQQLRKSGEAVAATSIRFVDSVGDFFSIFREVTVSGSGEYFQTRIGVNRAALAWANMKNLFFGSLPRFFVEPVLLLGVLLMIGVGFGSGDSEGGFDTAIIFLVGGAKIMGAMLPLQSALGNLKLYAPQAELAYHYLETATRGNVAPDGRRPETKPEPILVAEPLGVSMEKVSFSYPGGRGKGVRTVSLTIKPGEHFALVGQSGAGKTTIAELLIGILSPESGQILLWQESQGPVPFTRAGRVAYVSQFPCIISGTLAENVALGEPPGVATEQRVWEVLQLVGLGPFVSGLSEGIHTDMGRQATELSGGQIQRISLARAIYSRPGLLVLDEPTSALDDESEKVILEALSSIRAETTVLVISHKRSSVSGADRVALVEDGAIVRIASPKELDSYMSSDPGTEKDTHGGP